MSNLRLREVRTFQIVRTFFLEAGGEVLDSEVPSHHSRIVQALTEPDAVLGLAGAGRANAVMSLVQKLNKADQCAVLAAPNAVYGLAKGGEAEAVVDVLTQQDGAGQRAILQAPSAVSGLAQYGQARAVETIQASWAQPSQTVPARPSTTDANVGVMPRSTP